MLPVTPERRAEIRGDVAAATASDWYGHLDRDEVLALIDELEASEQRCDGWRERAYRAERAGPGQRVDVGAFRMCERIGHSTLGASVGYDQNWGEYGSRCRRCGAFVAAAPPEAWGRT